jgi:hypothetical protein
MPCDVDALALFCQIASLRQKVTRHSYSHLPAFTALIKAGLLADAGVVQSVHCDDCDMAHDAEVIFEQGAYGYFCPDLGFMPLDRAAIKAVAPQYNRLIAALADALNCKRRKSTPISGDCWRIGAVDTPGGDLTVYFQPTMQDTQDMRNFEAVLARETRSQYQLILTCAGEIVVPVCKTVLLSEVAEMAPGSHGLRFVRKLPEIVNAPMINKGGRPSPYRGNVQMILQDRQERGESLEGRNAEAKAVHVEYKTRFPNGPFPSLSTIKGYVSDS